MTELKKRSGPQIMSLTDVTIRNAKPKAKPYKLSDDKGLFILIQPSGGKLWRFKYRFNGIEKKLGIGRYPEITLGEARKRRDIARQQIASGIDPAEAKVRERLEAQESAAQTFKRLAEEYITIKMGGEQKAEATISKARWFLSLIDPQIGARPISELKTPEVLAALRVIEARGNHETAKKTRAFASRVFKYAAASGRCDSDPTALLQGALIKRKSKNLAAILDPKAYGAFLRAIDGYDGSFVTQMALLIAPHVFVRPGELRHAEWSEFDFEAKVWRIPEGKMKARRPHAVPLSEQVIGYLDQLAEVTGREGYVFASLRTPKRPMSENTLNAAFRRMGYSGNEVTAHGLRSSASTFLNESCKWHPDAIERALAHGDSDQIRGTYNRGQYWDERVTMMQWWSDHLDMLKNGAEIIPFNRSYG
jgi:integrase